MLSDLVKGGHTLCLPLSLMLSTTPPPYPSVPFSRRRSSAIVQTHLEETHLSIHCHLLSFTITHSINNYPLLQTNMLCLHTYLLPPMNRTTIEKNPHTNTRTPPKRTQLTKMMIFSQSLSPQLQHP